MSKSGHYQTLGVIRAQKHNRGNTTGHPSRYTPELAQEIADDIALGLNEHEACDRQYLKHATFLSWKNKHPELSDMIAKARADKMRARIIKADEGKSGDACWLLERVYGPRFARPEVAAQIQIINANMIDTGTHIHLSPATLETCRAQLNRIGSIPGKPAELLQD